MEEELSTVPIITADEDDEKDSRVRNWTFLTYPESALPDWKEKLDDLHLQWCCSPLHDLDAKPTGELKKPHWHVAVAFSGKKSYDQVLRITKRLGATIPQRVEDLPALVRYFIHLDNPEKAQYDRSDIEGHGGFDVEACFRPTSTKRYELIDEMVAYVSGCGITEVKDLIDYARHNRRNDWFPLLCDSCLFVMEKYIRSARHKTEGSVVKNV